MKVRLTLTEEMLGTANPNKDLHLQFVSSKAPDAKTAEEEIADLGVDAYVIKGRTIFPKSDGVPFYYDYQIKGFMKDACSMLFRVVGTRSSKLKAFRKVIDGLIFVYPRKIMIQTPSMSNCPRPLRAQTPQGERIAIADSESIPAGATLEFEIKLLDPGHEGVVIEWLQYGAMRGIGQWRNSGKGRFTYEIL